MADITLSQLTNGLEINSDADQEVWISGNLTYKITLTNTTDHPLKDIVVTDTLDPSIITLTDGSVTINQTATDDYTYDAVSGLLTIKVSSISIGETAVIMFQGGKM